jgi:hypothetical protein
VFRSQADPCYPENSEQDGCYPDNAALPSRFMCWITGQADPAQVAQPERDGKKPRGTGGRWPSSCPPAVRCCAATT